MNISIKKILLIISGSISLAIGFVGVFLPVLPTTPFVLLAGGCFIKSSKKLYLWMINNRVFGKYVDNYLKYRAVTLKSKVISLLFLWGMILSSAIFFVENMHFKILLIVIAVSVSAHIILLKQINE